MTIAHLIAFNIALLAALASPGPAFLVAVRTSLNSGMLAGVALGLGLGLTASIWTLLALLGLESIFFLVPWAYTTAKICGALYLFFIAWVTWKNAASPIQDKHRTQINAFRDGIFINLSNPKSVLFAAAILVVIFPPDMTATEIALVVTNHMAVEFIFYTALAYMMNTNAVRQKYLRAKSFLDKGASVILASLGLSLLFQKND